MGDIQKLTSTSVIRKVAWLLKALLSIYSVLLQGIYYSCWAFMDRHVSLNTVEVRNFIANLFTNSFVWVIFFLLQEIPQHLGYQALWQRGVRMTTDNMPLANLRWVLLIAFSSFTPLNTDAEDILRDLSREGFHCVLSSLNFILTYTAIIVYPLQYLRCCIEFICNNNSKQTHQLQSHGTQSTSFRCKNLTKKQNKVSSHWNRLLGARRV